MEIYRRFSMCVTVCALILVAVGSLTAGQPVDSDLEFFEKQVRPLLNRRCYRCHSSTARSLKGGLRLDSRVGVQRGGDSGPILVPGQPDASRLIHVIRYQGGVEMPPDSKLPKEEIAILVRWVQIGAPWPADRSERMVPEPDAGFPLQQRRRDQWCWQPIDNPRLPLLKDDWSVSAIDRFVYARMREHNLQPAAPADRSTWLRRVTFDLTGLPPSPAEVVAFATDATPHAHERVVERLLGSPRFGEHWARRWMDLVRYAETKAFESDYTMPYVYRYRDYLIRAFNCDVPYDQFVREHIAGDLLQQPRCNPVDGALESPLGAGYWYLNDGHHGPTDVHADEVRVFENMIDVTGKVFLAQTIACARCHDHKFDPITAGDYYSLYGILASSRFDYVNTVSPKVLALHRANLQQQRDQIEHELLRIWKSDLRTLRQQLAKAQSLDPLKHQPAWRRLLDSSVRVESKSASQRTEILTAPLRPVAEILTSADAQRIAAWQKQSQSEPSTPLARLGRIQGQTFGDWRTSGEGFGRRPVRPGTFVLAHTGEQVFQAMVRGPAAGQLTSRFGGSIKSPTFELGTALSVRVKGRHARVRLFVQHYELVGQGVTTRSLDQKVNSDVWQWITINTELWKGLRAYVEVLHNGDEMQVVTLEQHAPTHADDGYVALDDVTVGGPRQLLGVNDYARAWRIVGPAPNSRVQAALVILDRIDGLLKCWERNELTAAESDILDALTQPGGILAATVDRSAMLESLVRTFREQRQRVPEPIYGRSLTDGHGRDEPVYLRGDHQNMATKPVPRHFLAALDARPLATTGSGRLEWATQVVDPANPIAARVIVNRIWSYLTGRGIVASVDNFGAMGTPPTHPELLDHLAYRFRQDEWSLKKLIRKITLSSTYRLSTRPSPTAQRSDPTNLWLSHMSLRRLPAESIRDAILMASGRLREQMFGPSVPVNLQQTIPSRSKPKQEGPLDGAGRRSIYIEMRRNYLPNFLRAFDLPNSSVTCGRRGVTNVPIQALTLMNDPFVTEQARVWAEQIIVSSNSFRDRIDGLHYTAFARSATEQEQIRCRNLFIELAKQFDIEDANAKDNVQLWTELCHLMINRKEFIFLVGPALLSNN